MSERVEALEALVVVLIRLSIAQYESDIEATWPEDSDEMLRAYKERYGVDLSAIAER